METTNPPSHRKFTTGMGGMGGMGGFPGMPGMGGMPGMPGLESFVRFIAPKKADPTTWERYHLFTLP